MKRSAPIRRTRIRYKPKQHKESWRSGKVRLNPEEMMVLRCAVFARSEGYCEGEKMEIFGTGTRPMGQRYRCLTPIQFSWFHMHHIKHRSLGGSDTEKNIACLCLSCHRAQHGEIQWSKKETHDLEIQVSRP